MRGGQGDCLTLGFLGSVLVVAGAKFVAREGWTLDTAVLGGPESLSAILFRLHSRDQA
jgi:hypothetical protein